MLYGRGPKLVPSTATSPLGDVRSDSRVFNTLVLVSPSNPKLIIRPVENIMFIHTYKYTYK